MIGLRALVTERSNIIIKALILQPAGIERKVALHKLTSELEELCQFLVLVPATKEVILLLRAYWRLNGRAGDCHHPSNLRSTIAVECDGIAWIIISCGTDYGIGTLAPLPIVQLLQLIVLAVPTLHGGVQLVDVFFTLEPDGAAYSVLTASVMSDIGYLTILIDILGIVASSIKTILSIVDIASEEVIDKGVGCNPTAGKLVTGNKTLCPISAIACSFYSGT